MNDKNVKISYLENELKKASYKSAYQTIVVYNADALFKKKEMFSLQRNNKNPFSILTAPKLNGIDSFTLESIEKKFQEHVLDFFKTLINLNHVDLSYFLYNLKDLTIKKEFNFFTKYLTRKIYGYYFVDTNEIIISDIKNLFHELLHSASTIYDKEENVFCGFNQTNQSKNTNIGNGLNEGYTDILVNRYFNNNQNYLSFYQAEMYFAKKLEEIIGKDLMETLYFKADLFNLLEELKKYMPYEEIINFITNLDFIHYNIYNKEKRSDIRNNVEKSLISINKFILTCYCKKLKLLFDNGSITIKELESELLNYIHSSTQMISTAGKREDSTYYLYNDVGEEINAIIKEVFNDKYLEVAIHNPIQRK